MIIEISRHHQVRKYLLQFESWQFLVRVIPEDVQEPGGEAGCPKWYPDWSALDKLEPRIKLDPTKFLTPVLTYGFAQTQQHSFNCFSGRIISSEVSARRSFWPSNWTGPSYRLDSSSTQERTRNMKTIRTLTLSLHGIDSTYRRWRQWWARQIRWKLGKNAADIFRAISKWSRATAQEIGQIRKIITFLFNFPLFNFLFL